MRGHRDPGKLGHSGREQSREAGGGAVEHTVNDLPSVTHKREGVWSLEREVLTLSRTMQFKGQCDQ